MDCKKCPMLTTLRQRNKLGFDDLQERVCCEGKEQAQTEAISDKKQKETAETEVVVIGAEK